VELTSVDGLEQCDPHAGGWCSVDEHGDRNVAREAHSDVEIRLRDRALDELDGAEPQTARDALAVLLPAVAERLGQEQIEPGRAGGERTEIEAPVGRRRELVA